MQRVKSQKFNYLAPRGRCNKCGVEKNDWSFKYQGLCSDCYKEWRQKRAEFRRSLKQPNINIELEKNIIVTQNVSNRLEKQAQSQIPFSKRYSRAERLISLTFLIAFTVPVLIGVLKIELPFKFARDNVLLLLSLWCILTMLAVYLIERVSKVEVEKRLETVKTHFIELAKQRKQRIDEAKYFYTSPEWKLLRKDIIKAFGRVCNNCGVTILNDDELTVDHIQPRSHFPGQALMKNNLQVLCRSCNSKKGNRIFIN